MGRGHTRGRKASAAAAAAGTRGAAAAAGRAGVGRSGTAAAARVALGRSPGRRATVRDTARRTTAAAQAGTGTRKDTAAGTVGGTAGSAAGGRRGCRAPSPPGRLAPWSPSTRLRFRLISRRDAVWRGPEKKRAERLGGARVVGGDNSHDAGEGSELEIGC